eukprot:g14810.t1
MTAALQAASNYALKAKEQRRKHLLKGKLSVDTEPLSAANTTPCPMCKEAMLPRNAKRLPCGHGFHFDCIDPYLRRELQRNGNATPLCPVCREPAVETIDSVVAKRKRELLEERELAENGRSGLLGGRGMLPMSGKTSTPRGRLVHNLRKFGRGENYYSEVADLWTEVTEKSSAQQIAEIRARRDESFRHERNDQESEEELFRARDEEIRGRWREFVLTEDLPEETGSFDPRSSEPEVEFALPDFLKKDSQRKTVENAPVGVVLGKSDSFKPTKSISFNAANKNGIAAAKTRQSGVNQKPERSTLVAPLEPRFGGGGNLSPALLECSEQVDLESARRAEQHFSSRNPQAQVLPLSEAIQRNGAPNSIPGLKLTPRSKVANQDLLLYKNPMDALKREVDHSAAVSAPGEGPGRAGGLQIANASAPSRGASKTTANGTPTAGTPREASHSKTSAPASAEPSFATANKRGTKLMVRLDLEGMRAQAGRSEVSRRETVDDDLGPEHELSLAIVAKQEQPHEISNTRRKGALNKMHAALEISEDFFKEKATLDLSPNRKLQDKKKKTGKRGGVKFADSVDG